MVYVHWNTCCCAITKSCPTLCNPMDCTCQAPLSMGFSRQEYWSGLSFPPPEDLLDPWIEPTSPVSPALAGRFFTAEPPVKPVHFEDSLPHKGYHRKTLGKIFRESFWLVWEGL